VFFLLIAFVKSAAAPRLVIFFLVSLVGMMPPMFLTQPFELPVAFASAIAALVFL